MKKDYKSRFENFVKSDFFIRNYRGKSLGEIVAVEQQKNKKKKP